MSKQTGKELEPWYQEVRRPSIMNSKKEKLHANIESLA